MSRVNAIADLAQRIIDHIKGGTFSKDELKTVSIVLHGLTNTIDGIIADIEAGQRKSIDDE